MSRVKDFTELLSTTNPNRVKRGTWESVENRKIYAKWLGERLRFDSNEDWYQITRQKMTDLHGGGLLHGYYNGSLTQFVMAMFPDYDLKPYKFSSPKGYWENKENQKSYAHDLCVHLGYQKKEDWYQITAQQINDFYGGGLLTSYYHNSPSEFVMAMFPEYHLKPYKFEFCANGYWKSKENRKSYAIDLGVYLGYKKKEDWYRITQQQIHDFHGSGLLAHHYNGSPSDFVMTVFREYHLKPYKFNVSPTGYWKSEENKKSYAHDLGVYLGYKKSEDWYQLTAQQIHDFHGRTVVKNYYHGSPTEFVMAMFPDYDLKLYKFVSAPREYWKSEENQKSYAHDLGVHLGYQKKEDWYQITQQQMRDFHGGTLLIGYYNGSTSKFVMAMFPEYHLELSKFRKNYSQGQMQWLNYMCVETPDVRHILNHEDGEYRIPNSRYHADGYSVSNNRIYEYDGDFYHGNPKIHNQDDMNRRTKTTFGELYENTLNKKQFCEDSGYNVISIWESEWVRANLTVIKLQQKWKNRKH